VKILRSAVLLIEVIVFWGSLIAQTPNKISYQGLLTTVSGPVSDGSYTLKFDVYNAPASGTLRHTETFSGVSVQQGTFNVMLGSTTTLPAIFSESLYVEVTATAGPAGLSFPLTFSPRSELTASPYSLAPWATSGGNLFYNSGNVGIGTIVPSHRLHVSGDDDMVKLQSQTAGSNFDGMVFYNNTGTRLGGIRSHTSVVQDGLEDDLELWSESGDVTFSRGNVGIGTSSPSDLLTVGSPSTRGVIRVDGSSLLPPVLGLADTRVNGKTWGIYSGSPSIGDFGINDASAGTVPFVIKQGSGNVGIGTTSPLSKLDVYGNATLGSATSNNIALDIRGPNAPTDPNSAQDIRFSFYAAGSSGIRGYRGNSWGTSLQFLTTPLDAGADNPLVRMHISENGNVGIGMTEPMEKLVVFGDINQIAIIGVPFGPTGVGVEGWDLSGGGGSTLAGRFVGDVNVTGKLSKVAGSFKIDHPLNPENKYLYHSFVESPDMKNIYDGTITTDVNGDATIRLPEWFEALNKDFRYQLTVLGQFAQAIVSKKIEGNKFSIKTDKPTVEVSWQVTGIRHDAYADAHRIPIEETKPDRERGHYQFPDLYGQPEEKSIEWATHPEMMKSMKAEKEKRSIKGKE